MTVETALSTTRNQVQDSRRKAGRKLVNPGSQSWVTRWRTAFTLVELLIVVSILGILAAIVLPEFQGHVQQSRETAAKSNLRVLRDAIERYAADHKGVPPGYFMNDPTKAVSGMIFKNHLVSSTTPYIRELPENPFNNLRAVLVLDNATNIPALPTQCDINGWIYKPSTKQIKLNWPGTDSEGTAYFDY